MVIQKQGLLFCFLEQLLDPYFVHGVGEDGNMKRPLDIKPLKGIVDGPRHDADPTFSPLLYVLWKGEV